MVDKKISALTAATETTGFDFAGVQSGETKKISFSLLGIVPSRHPGYVTGRYYHPEGTFEISPVELIANIHYAVPFFVPVKTTFTKIGIRCTTLASSSACRLGIYDSPAGQPGSLILDAGTVSTTSTGDKEKTISQELEAGNYFLTLLSNGTPTINFASTAAYGYANFGTANSSTHQYTQYRSQAYAALPASFGAVTYLDEGAGPDIWMRK